MTEKIHIQISHAEIRPPGETSRIMVQEVIGDRMTTVEAIDAFDPSIAAKARQYRDSAAELPIAADFFDRDLAGKSVALIEALSAGGAKEKL